MNFDVDANSLPLSYRCMVSLNDLVAFCDQRTRRIEFPDFPQAFNGLQVENNGMVSKVASSVDASLETIERAVQRKADFLIVHHGLFWNQHIPYTRRHYKKLKTLLDNNLALYSSHLPLDGHPEIGNAALLARELGFEVIDGFCEFQGETIGVKVSPVGDLKTLRSMIEASFSSVVAIEQGPEIPSSIGILTGSGGSLIDEIEKYGIDTLITGEAKQHHFVLAQEIGLNLFLCGHTATEVFAVDALAREVAEKFQLPCVAIPSENPL